NMPHVFAHESKKNQMPTGAAIVNGIVASVLVLLSPVMELAGFDGFFWIFFSMNIVFLLISYIPMFPAFLKLRTIDPAANRVFKVPGGRGVALVVAWVPVILLVLAIIATIVPLNGSPEEMSKIPMLIGVIAFVILGELVRIWSARGRRTTTAAWARAATRSSSMAHGYEEMPESEKIAVEEDLIIGREPRDLM
ncbi:MAG: amino acid permease, partial [Eggerthellaceae bacterium]